MPKTYTVGHRPLFVAVQAWMLKKLLGRETPAWPPRQRLG